MANGNFAFTIPGKCDDAVRTINGSGVSAGQAEAAP
jgi:hypothetical protein